MATYIPQRAEDSPHTTGDMGVPVLGVSNEAATARHATDGDYGTIALDSVGRVGVTNLGGTFTTSLASGSRVIVDGGDYGFGNIPWHIDVNGNGNVTMSSLVPGTGGTNLGKAEDTGHTNGATGVMALGVRQSTPIDLSAGGTNNDYEPFQVDASGRVWVNNSSVTQPVSDNSGSLTVDAPVGTPVFATITPSTTGGWTPASITALSNTKTAIKAGAGTFGGYMIYNPNASVIYVQVFNVAIGSITVGTTAPTYVLSIPATSGANLEIANGINHSTEINVAATTTPTGSTAPAFALVCAFWYK